MDGRTGPRVLVVDDEPQVRRVVGLALRRAGLDVADAADGAEAVRLFRAGGFAVVLLDVQMPGLDGPATLAALRELDPGVRVVFMSGDTGRYPVGDLLRLGAADVLAKPFGTLRAVTVLVSELVRGDRTPN